MNKTVLLLFLTSTLVSGCAKKEIENNVIALANKVEILENQLGNYKYVGLKPQIKVTILKQEFEEATTSYGSPEYYLSGVVRREEEFPLNRIGLTIGYVLTFNENHKHEGIIHVDMKGDSTAFETSAYMSEIPNILKNVTPKIEVTETNWWPIELIEVELETK